MADEVLVAENLMRAHPGKALGHLVEAWRSTFDPSLGRLIEALGASLAVPVEGLPTRKGERADALAHLALEADDAQRSGVLAAFEEFAQEAAGRLVWPSIEAWAETEPDPRVAHMALRLLTRHEHGLTAKLWRRLVNCVERHGDLGVVEDARAYEATLIERGGGWGYSAERFSNVLKKLTKARACKRPADPEVIRRLQALVPARASVPAPTTEDPGPMLEAIAAQPSDDGPRLVYADWLTERRQPLGEFIVLQIARTRARGKVAAKAKEREAELLASQRRALLGPFDGVVARSGLRFERGFLVAARATGELSAHPLTRLLQRVEFDEGFAKGARFDSLTSARGPDGQRDELPAVAPNLAKWDVPGDRWPELVKVLGPLRLSELAVRGLERGSLDGLLRELFTSQGARTLASLELSLGRSCVPRMSLDPLPASLTSIVIHFGNQLDATFTLREGGWALALEANYFAHSQSVLEATRELVACFRATPLVLATLRLPSNIEQRERFEAALAAAALEVRVRRAT